MKQYRVHISEERCADIYTNAKSADEAERKVLQNAARITIDWSDFELAATNVDEVDKDGNEIA
jgi:hypothetical protein